MHDVISMQKMQALRYVPPDSPKFPHFLERATALKREFGVTRPSILRIDLTGLFGSIVLDKRRQAEVGDLHVNEVITECRKPSIVENKNEISVSLEITNQMEDANLPLEGLIQTSTNDLSRK
jgi:hypothetical protein